MTGDFYMKLTKRLLYTLANIIAGGVALISILISYTGVDKPDALYFYLVGILTWVFASIILLMRPDHDVVRRTYLMSVGFMIICSIGKDSSIYDGTWKSLFVHIPELISVSFLPCLFFSCFAVFPSTKKFAKNNLFKYLVYAPGIVLFVIMLISYLSGNKYSRSFFLINIKPVLITNFIFLFSYSIAGQLCLLHTWRYGERDGATYTQRKQAKWIFLGISIGLVPLSALHTVPFALGFDLPVNIGGYSAYTLVAIMICYVIGIIRHRLMAIDLAINRSSVYAIVSSIILASYLLISKFFGNVILDISGKKEIALDLISILIVAMLFAPLKQRVQEIIDKHFDQERYAYHMILESLGEALSSILSLKELADVVTGELNKALKPEFIALLLKNRSDYEINKSTGNMGELTKTLGNLDLNATGDNPEVIAKKHLVIPLSSKREKIGIILLGGKVSGREYNREDISLMKTLSHEIAIAVENASIYETLRERLNSMEEAYARLKESLKILDEDTIVLDEPKLLGLDLISELGIIADALVGGSEKLREMDELKSQILADVSHGLRTPLTSIKGYAKNLLDGIVGELNENQMHNIERIYQNCDWLLWLINNLLNLTRIEAGKMDFTPSEVRVSSIINDIVSEFAPVAKKEEIMLMVDCPSDMTITADGDNLKLVISNLIHNAIKFTDKDGKVYVRAYDDGNCIQISVKDTGIGISPDGIERIFQRYVQLQHSSGGIGIGLAIVKSIVEIHGGTISVESEPGTGSYFIISLPKSLSSLAQSDHILES